MNGMFFRAVVLGLILIAAPARVNQLSAVAHEGHQAATYRVSTSADHVESQHHLRLRVIDEASGLPTAARFTLLIDGEPYIPDQLGANGLRFVSIHQRKQHVLAVTYCRGTGEVLVPIPAGAKSGRLTVAKGFEFFPATKAFEVNGPTTEVEVALRRWSNLHSEGWRSADAHLHYERLDPKHDADWLTMLDGDGLTHAHFMVLKGGNLPGIWAEQFAYGKAGEANDGERLIRPGEEYRDATQGHINLLGVEAIIPPISTGGIGQPRIEFNYPPLVDVFRKTHELEGIAGPAHGGSLARSSTAVLDTVLGVVDFFEVANTHLYKTDVWYQLLSCGFIVPPMGGTDLPNFGFRDPWQPLLGEIRTYVRSGADVGFVSWKEAVRRGEVFITSGPMIRFEVNGVGPGGTVRIETPGEEVTVSAELASPRPLTSLEVVHMGQASSAAATQSFDDGIYRIQIQRRMKISDSCWLAARGSGGPKKAVEEGLKIKQSEIAHTGVVRVIVGERPIRKPEAVEELKRQLVTQQEYYRSEAKFEKPEHRLRFFDLFGQAIRRLDEGG